MDIWYVDRARVFATAAHYAIGQTRKYKGEPYIVHPGRVAEIVSIHARQHSNAMVAAAASLPFLSRLNLASVPNVCGFMVDLTEKLCYNLL